MTAVASVLFCVSVLALCVSHAVMGRELARQAKVIRTLAQGLGGMANYLADRDPLLAAARQRAEDEAARHG